MNATDDGSSRSASVRLGIDVGSVSVKVALVSAGGAVVSTAYRRHYGQPAFVLAELLEAVLARPGSGVIAGAGITGTGARAVAALLGATPVNEVLAHLAAAAALTPSVRSVIDIGGQDARLVLADRDPGGGVVLADFAMNSLCAAGTGSFLDQQASRLGLRIEDEFGAMALRSRRAPRIAGRCSVFAKSDMIHLQQRATPDFEIVAGLCEALARSFVTGVARGHAIRRPIGFHGGVASNAGMVAAFRRVLELEDGSLVVHEHHSTMGAIGAALLVSPGARVWQIGPREMAALSAPRGVEGACLPPLVPGGQVLRFTLGGAALSRAATADRIPAYLGIDIGSISTNVVVVAEGGEMLAKRYLMTAGRPIEAVRRGLAEVGDELGERVAIRGACTTGSGRYLIGDLVGADVVKNEITAHARAAVEADPAVDTIFEIGGQDSKYVSLEGGRVVDFEMNKACAAGTGSFLEEQAERLGIRIEELGDAALRARAPVRLGERCTVFMESDLVHHQQAGADRDNLAAGLSVSIVENYLNRVVNGRKVGERIFFQGGVAFNTGVVSAFEAVTGKQVTVPEHHEVMGAIGCALMARDAMRDGHPTRFRGFDVSSRPYAVSPFTCRGCANQCEVNRVELEGERPLFYGGRCEKYEVARRKSSLPDLFAERQRLLESYVRAAPESAVEIGVPRALILHDYLPFFATLLAGLGLRVALSAPTTERTIREGADRAESEICFPAKVALGHVAELIDRGLPFVFAPHVSHTARAHPAFVDSVICPYVQAWPYMARAGLNGGRARLVVPAVRFDLEGDLGVVAPLAEALRPLGIGSRDVGRALPAAHEAQREFAARLRARGAEVLASLDPGDRAVVIVSRPYNGCDRGVNLNVPAKLDSLGVLAIPMDMLPLDERAIHAEWHEMFWRYGQRLLSAARVIRADPRLFPVYLTNFGCGPDSFVGTFFRDEMNGTPLLQLEIDEHSADAGVLTRLEAFLDSLDAAPGRREEALSRTGRAAAQGATSRRRVYLPSAGELAGVLAAAFKGSGADAEVLPEPDHESIELGRQHTTGRECYPCVITTGDLVRLVRRPGFDPAGAAFFMPSSCGPCRFGMYHVLHRAVLDRLGLPQVSVFAPAQNTSFYDDLGIVGSRFARLAWNGVVAGELLGQVARRLRPYEVEPGTTDRVYQTCLGHLCRLVAQAADLAPLMRESGLAFAGIARNGRERKPRIGVVGEIFVRMQPFANDHVVERLERHGAEVVVVPFTEWVEFLNFINRRVALMSRQWRPLLQTVLSERIQARDRRRLEAALGDAFALDHEGHVRHTVARGAKYLHPSLDAEAILTLGKASEYHEHGLSGIVNVMPFGCMPGNISAALFRPLREDHDQIPVLNLAYDGQQDLATSLRIEAFLEQCRQYHRRRRSA